MKFQKARNQIDSFINGYFCCFKDSVVGGGFRLFVFFCLVWFGAVRSGSFGNPKLHGIEIADAYRIPAHGFVRCGLLG